MTKREAAIISAYTGIFIGDQKELIDYLSEKYGRPIFDFEVGFLDPEQISTLAYADFVGLEVV